MALFSHKSPNCGKSVFSNYDNSAQNLRRKCFKIIYFVGLHLHLHIEVKQIWSGPGGQLILQIQNIYPKNK